MKIISITGKTGSGKSTLSKMLAEKLNCNTINIDKIGHQATNDDEITKKLCQTFGNEILGEDKKINRKKLGNIVFSNKEQMDKLTDITWEFMQNVLDKILEQEKNETIILEWALLPISKYWDISDIKILIKAEDEKRKIKVIERDNITEEYFLKRDSRCIDYKSYHFDYIFENDYKLETINNMIKTINKE